VLLHPNCHQQVHRHESGVSRPRPSRGVGGGLSRVRGNSHARF
jgi:hypothetical protein